MAQLPNNVKAVIAVASGKGGVGKSTVTTNLAAALSQQGLKVGIVDADVYGPSQPRMLGLTDNPPTSGDGTTIQPAQNYGIQCMSMGFLVAEGEPIVWRGPMVLSALKQMLFQVEWGQPDAPLDLLLLDMPPGTGDIQLSIAQQVALSGAVIVSTPQDIAWLDAHKGLTMFQKVQVPILGVIENMSSFICPNCQHETHIFSHGGAKAHAEELKVPFLGEIPLDLAIREQTDAGKPLVACQPQSAQAQAFMAVAQAVQNKLAEQQNKAAGPVKIVFEEAS